MKILGFFKFSTLGRALANKKGVSVSLFHNNEWIRNSSGEL